MKHLRITIDGKTYDVQVEIQGEENAPAVQPLIGRPVQAASVAAAPSAPAKAAPKPAAAAGPGQVLSPLAAVVVGVDVTEGQQVKEGDKLITLEAMKMNTIIQSPASGTVRSLGIKPGDAVAEGELLAVIE